MQRLFSMFPRGLPGLALLLLRLSVALSVLVVVYVKDPVAWLLVAAGMLALSLVAGLLTPLSAAICVVAQLVSLPGPVVPVAILIAMSALNALALALLGPGAYSIDALRFGRRIVKLASADDE